MKNSSIAFALCAGILLSGCATAGHEYGPAYGGGYDDYAAYGDEYGTYERARVVDAQPIYDTVSTPVSRRVCREVPVRRVQRDGGSAAATILGGLIGGLAGHQIGSGSGNTAATVAGAIAGAAIGQHASNDPDRVYRGVQTRCHRVRDYQRDQRLSGYRVTYQYNGETFTTRTAQHPGKWIRVKVSVVPVE